jgi:ribosomal protein S18 acetylase RimI-like enzyme
VVEYRTFRNTDPPGLAALWNEALTTRGEVRLRHSSPLENYVFSKSYFDPSGLFVAVENGDTVGFAHAGFGADSTLSTLSRAAGVTCAIAVRPSHRRRGIGSELLRACEKYLKVQGAQNLYAGPMAPLNPFYFALYGGSELPGFLASDKGVDPFLQQHGYRVHDTRHVFDRQLSQPIAVADGRFAGLRRQFDVRIVPRTGVRSWWEECTVGPVEIVDFRLEEKGTGHVAARASVWEMDLFSWCWNQPAIGIVDVDVAPEMRRQGLAKYLLTQVLRYLQEQFFGLAEVQSSAQNVAALNLYRSVGFEEVDVGHLYRKE